MSLKNAANRPRRYKLENHNDSTDEHHEPRTSTQISPTSIFKKSLNWKRHESTGQPNQYVKSDPPTRFFHRYDTDESIYKGYPSVVWRQQMETTYIGRPNKKHLLEKKLLYTKNSHTKHFYTVSTFIGNKGLRATVYWSTVPTVSFLEEKLELKNNFDKSPEQNEGDVLITDSLVSDKLRYALIDLRTVNSQPLNISPLPKFRPPFTF